MRRGTWIEDLRTYREFYQRPTALVAEVLRELKLEGGRIGYEGEYLGGVYCDELRAGLPGAALAPCDKLLQRVRSIKTTREIELLRHAYNGTANALLATFVIDRAGSVRAQHRAPAVGQHHALRRRCRHDADLRRGRQHGSACGGRRLHGAGGRHPQERLRRPLRRLLLQRRAHRQAGPAQRTRTARSGAACARSSTPCRTCCAPESAGARSSSTASPCTRRVICRFRSATTATAWA